MILTCPECATRYFLPDVQIGRDGRKVKCAQCGHAWREFPQPVSETPEADAEPQPSEPPPPVVDDGTQASPGAGRRAEILREKKAVAERRAKQAATVNAAIWEGLAATVVLLLVLAAVFRGQVVRFAPGTATAYAAVGLPVNSTGLLIEKVRALPSLLIGHRALTVTGTLRNVATGPVAAPAFRVDILNGDGRPMDHRVIQITAPPLQRGEVRPFSLGVADPPLGYQDVAVTFAMPAAKSSAPPAAKAVAPAAAKPGAH